MRLAIVTAFWKRPAVSRVYWAGIARLRERFRFDVVAVVSPGDRENHQLAGDYGAYVIETANAPLSSKWNKGVQYAQKRLLVPDYVMTLGSDDLISDNAFAWLVQRGEEARADYIGLRDFYFADFGGGGGRGVRALKHWQGYPAGDTRFAHPAGSGRLLSAELLNRLNWEVAPGEPRNRSLDWALDVRLRELGAHPPVTTSLAETRGMAVDLKTRVNIWEYESLPGEPADPAMLRDHFSEREITLMHEVGR